LEESLPELLAVCAAILSASPVFVLLNVYTTVLSRGRLEKHAEDLQSSLRQMLRKFRMAITSGELALADPAGRRISASAFARAEFHHLG
jgi:hypothetical protein